MKRSQRISGWKAERQLTRQKEAQERQAVYDNMSTEDKLVNIELRPGSSLKERKKLS